MVSRCGHPELSSKPYEKAWTYDLPASLCTNNAIHALNKLSAQLITI